MKSNLNFFNQIGSNFHLIFQTRYFLYLPLSKIKLYSPET